MENNINWPGWETVGLIGRGSFGAVYEIQRDVLGDVEKAALKVLSIPQSSGDIDEMYNDGYDDESITSTFQRHLKSIVAEYSLMRKMSGSANIVNCDDVRYVQHEDGFGWDIFIKMELLTPLAKALPADIPEETVIKVAKDLCAALELCKQHDIVHRDIKPQNIFLSPNGDYKLGDFGIANTVEKTMGGTKTGTYKYMAPEVYNNQPYGAAADIYSLGLVLYWMLNERRMPFLPLPPVKLGAGMEDQARLRRFNGEQLPPPAHGSKQLQNIVLKACAFDPKKRYQSAAEMYKNLSLLSFSGVSTSVSGNKSIPDSDTQTVYHRQDDTHISSHAPYDTPHSSGTAAQSQSTAESNQISKFILASCVTIALICICITAFTLIQGKHDKNPESSAVTPETDEFYVVEVPVETTVPAEMVATESTVIKETEAQEHTSRIPEYGVIAAGYNHSVRLNPDGTVYAVGKATVSANGTSRLDTQGWTDIVAISAAQQTVGLKSDGTVVTCGPHANGEGDLSHWTEIEKIFAARTHTVGLKRDGTVVAKGGTKIEGQCNVSHWRDIIDIAASQIATFGLRKDGTIISAGHTDWGENWTNIKAICAGENHLVGLRNDGTVVAAGAGDIEYINQQLSLWEKITQISASNTHIVGLKEDGTVVVYNLDQRKNTTCDVSGWSEIAQVCAGTNFIIGLKYDGSIESVGYNEDNRRALS